MTFLPQSFQLSVVRKELTIDDSDTNACLHLTRTPVLGSRPGTGRAAAVTRGAHWPCPAQSRPPTLGPARCLPKTAHTGPRLRLRELVVLESLDRARRQCQRPAGLVGLRDAANLGRKRDLDSRFRMATCQGAWLGDSLSAAARLQLAKVLRNATP
jgi:hypothetical protein